MIDDALECFHKREGMENRNGFDRSFNHRSVWFHVVAIVDRI